jgi:hypothetical protein
MLRRLLPVAAVAVLATGCSKAPYDTAAVSGRVTLNGEPLAGVAVMFQPIAPDGNINPGPGSYGITDADGRYSLTLIGKETPGAVVGKHKVRIALHDDTPQDISDDTPKRRTKAKVQPPPKYDRAEALLEFEVSAKGSTSADFELKP